MELDAKIPEAPIEDMWSTHKEHMRLVGPRNRPQYKVIVVGTGLAGASAASSMAAMGSGKDSKSAVERLAPLKDSSGSPLTAATRPCQPSQ